jgi:arylsulfatase
MLDDAGFAQADTYGGEIRTPTLSRIANSGISYNAFHTTAMCSPTRASLLTGRNHHRVGNGQIAELANDWDGYTGVIPRTSATVAQVLKYYGYSTAAFGKWHNTPIDETTAMGPFDRWPTGYGFDYFYGFIGGETSQWEPRLYRNTSPIEPPAHDPTYNLTGDLATQAVEWIQKHEVYAPNKPFFIYWTPGAVHGPHQVFKSWSDKYKGKFDDGWDAYRQRVFDRQKSIGWIPAETRLTPRPATLPAWNTLPPEQKKFQARLMEVYAGFLEYADTQAGRIIDELEKEKLRKNTLIFYVFSDNGASAEGMEGTISELLAQNAIPTTFEQQMKALSELGGLDALGGPKTDNMYNAAWAWAGSAPFQGTKLVAGYFGGTRTPLAVSWPAGIKPDKKPRPQFHHVVDIVPTVYDVVGITPPRVVDGSEQDPIDGISMKYTFNDATAKGRKSVQYFEIMGSRGVYHEGWMASVFGPRIPWSTDVRGLMNWNPDKDVWSLYNLANDYSQSTDLAPQMPDKTMEMKDWFTIEASRNRVFPVGGGLFIPLNPTRTKASTQTEWSFPDGVVRTPEFVAPNLRSRSNVVTVDAEFPEKASGVLYALGGISGGLTLYVDDGNLVYEYNTLAIWRTKIRAAKPIPKGRNTITIETTMTSPDRAAPADIVLKLNGQEVARGRVNVTVPLGFTATETFDVGTDLGSPVSLDYFDRAPFSFNGSINEVHVKYLAPVSPSDIDVADPD